LATGIVTRDAVSRTKQEEFEMKERVPGLTIATYSLAALALLLTTSCSKLDAIEQQTNKTQDQINKAQDRLNRIEEKLDQAGTSRFQIVVANESASGAVLFLLDTHSGETSIYRPPVGAMINGFWSNIPKLTYSDDYWQRAMTQGQPAPPAAAQPRPTQPAPATPTK
jgi:hypothetical protein